MRGFTYTPRASLEIKQIADYTDKHWGHAQAIKYINDMEALFVQLTLFPGMGETIETPNARTQKISFQSHVVYYDISDTSVIILAVIHKNQIPDF